MLVYQRVMYITHIDVYIYVYIHLYLQNGAKFLPFEK